MEVPGRMRMRVWIELRLCLVLCDLHAGDTIVPPRVCESVEAQGRVSGAELRSDERYDSQGGVSMTGLSWDHVRCRL